LLPFISKYHSENNKVFWPDKASSHYATKTIDFLRANNVKYVDKYRNLTNVPQCRPIEDLFGYLSGKVYSNGWSANNLTKLENRIKYCLKNIDINVVQRSVDSVKKRLRKCAEEGPFAFCH
jgi:glutamine cyclotransferase